jgi:hypothetical protein
MKGIRTVSPCEKWRGCLRVKTRPRIFEAMALPVGFSNAYFKSLGLPSLVDE